MVVVNECRAHAALLAANPGLLRNVSERAVALVAQETHAVGQAHGEIGVPIIVEIAGGAAQAAARELQMGRFSRSEERRVGKECRL